MNSYRASRLRARLGVATETAAMLALIIWGADDE